ncbi:MAG: hypothetical protein H7062_19960 [Candidatus Saccharimonas sp.]|nr:hypothetical protein [Planctomycetaceae bacterium]
MRCSSLRRTIVGGLSWICVLAGGLFAPAWAEDHPFAVVALASFDRVVARAASLGEAAGQPEAGDALLVSFLGGDDELKKLFSAPAFDTTRPLGIMSYPKWFSGKAAGAEDGDSKVGSDSDSVYEPSWTDLFEDPLSLLAEGILENSTVVICLPAKDREQLLATIAEMTKVRFTPIAGRTGWYEADGDENGDMIPRVAFVGRYLLLIIDEGKAKQWDRNYPDFEKLAKSSLGQNGFAYSLYRSGLPKVVREDMAEAFKMAHAATLQRQDNEPEAAFKVRTMFGPLVTESLDLLLSQIEEFRITGHVDSDTHQVMVDVELIGPKDGKLAKLANGLTTKSSLFGNISTEDAVFTANVSLPLSPKLWQPVANALRVIGDSNHELTWLPEIARTLAKTIEVGQFELHVSYTNGGEGLLALRVAGNAAFPENVQAALESFGKPVDSVEGWPIHQLPSSVLGYVGLLGVAPTDLFSARLFKNTGRVEIEVDGNKREVTEVTSFTESQEPISCWLAATPNSIWLALGSPSNHDCPAWFKSAIEASLAKPTAKAAANRNNAPVRALLRGLGASPPATDSANEKPRDAKVTQAAAKGVEKGEEFVIDVDLGGAEKLDIVGGGVKPRKLTAEELAVAKAQHERAEQQERERGDLLRDGSNAIRVELRPTANGLRVRTTFDDAYFHWFAMMMKHSLDEQAEFEVSNGVELPAPAPPPPPKRID